jgi:hypothetical protein
VTRYLTRRETGWRETVAAAAVGAGLGALGFYFARILLARSELPARPPEGEDRDLIRLVARSGPKRLQSREEPGGADE